MDVDVEDVYNLFNDEDAPITVAQFYKLPQPAMEYCVTQLRLALHQSDIDDMDSAVDENLDAADTSGSNSSSSESSDDY